ncbi:unnamed protein product [Trypanosoma congolense IL3000]|nr:unnamed protein product [Trypanosoma congolense IL3000]
MASTGADNTTTDKRNQVALFKKVNQLQKLCIRHGRSLCTQQQNLVQLNITCATLSERQSAAERQLDHFSSIIPNMLDSKETPRFVGDELPADDMTATELELYIAHSSAAVRNLERDISEQNSILGRKKRKLADLHEKYQAAVSRSRKRCRTSEGSKCEERGRTRDSGLSALLSSSDAEGDLRPSKLRENRPSFVLVDSHENSTANDQQPFIISSGESSDVEEVARNGSGGGEREVVIIEDSPARSLVSGGSTPRRISARGSEQRGQSENFRGASGGVPGELGSEEDVTWFSRAQRVRSTIQNVLIPNVARILPRRVDRLFQSSLGGF